MQRSPSPAANHPTFIQAENKQPSSYTKLTIGSPSCLPDIGTNVAATRGNLRNVVAAANRCTFVAHSSKCPCLPLHNPDMTTTEKNMETIDGGSQSVATTPVKIKTANEMKLPFKTQNCSGKAEGWIHEHSSCMESRPEERAFQRYLLSKSTTAGSGGGSKHPPRLETFVAVNQRTPSPPLTDRMSPKLDERSVANGTSSEHCKPRTNRAAELRSAHFKSRQVSPPPNFGFSTKSPISVKKNASTANKRRGGAKINIHISSAKKTSCHRQQKTPSEHASGWTLRKKMGSPPKPKERHARENREKTEAIASGSDVELQIVSPSGHNISKCFGRVIKNPKAYRVERQSTWQTSLKPATTKTSESSECHHTLCRPWDFCVSKEDPMTSINRENLPASMEVISREASKRINRSHGGQATNDFGCYYNAYRNEDSAEVLSREVSKRANWHRGGKAIATKEMTCDYNSCFEDDSMLAVSRENPLTSAEVLSREASERAKWSRGGQMVITDDLSCEGNSNSKESAEVLSRAASERAKWSRGGQIAVTNGMGCDYNSYCTGDSMSAISGKNVSTSVEEQSQATSELATRTCGGQVIDTRIMCCDYNSSNDKQGEQSLIINLSELGSFPECVEERIDSTENHESDNREAVASFSNDTQPITGADCLWQVPICHRETKVVEKEHVYSANVGSKNRSQEQNFQPIYVCHETNKCCEEPADSAYQKALLHQRKWLKQSPGTYNRPRVTLVEQLGLPDRCIRIAGGEHTQLPNTQKIEMMDDICQEWQHIHQQHSPPTVMRTQSEFSTLLLCENRTNQETLSVTTTLDDVGTLSYSSSGDSLKNCDVAVIKGIQLTLSAVSKETLEQPRILEAISPDVKLICSNIKPPAIDACCTKNVCATSEEIQNLESKLNLTQFSRDKFEEDMGLFNSNHKSAELEEREKQRGRFPDSPFPVSPLPQKISSNAFQLKPSTTGTSSLATRLRSLTDFSSTSSTNQLGKIGITKKEKQNKRMVWSHLDRRKSREKQRLHTRYNFQNNIDALLTKVKNIIKMNKNALSEECISEAFGALTSLEALIRSLKCNAGNQNCHEAHEKATRNLNSALADKNKAEAQNERLQRELLSAKTLNLELYHLIRTLSSSNDGCRHNQQGHMLQNDSPNRSTAANQTLEAVNHATEHLIDSSLITERRSQLQSIDHSQHEHKRKVSRISETLNSASKHVKESKNTQKPSNSAVALSTVVSSVMSDRESDSLLPDRESDHIQHGLPPTEHRDIDVDEQAMSKYYPVLIILAFLLAILLGYRCLHALFSGSSAGTTAHPCEVKLVFSEKPSCSQATSCINQGTTFDVKRGNSDHALVNDFVNALLNYMQNHVGVLPH